MIDVEVTTIDVDKLTAKLLGAADDAATAMAEEINREAQANVPVDSGDLKRSGKVHPSKRGKATARVTFGGGKVKYAAIVHELAGKGFMFLRNSAMRAKTLNAIAAKVFRDRMGGQVSEGTPAAASTEPQGFGVGVSARHLGGSR